MIRTRTDGDVRVVTLDRPEARNALRPDDLTALREAFDGTGSESNPPVTLLRGAGDAFCAGADLDAVAALDDPAAFARRGQRAAAAIEESPSVVVCGIDGPARGGGVELALSADVRVATPGATLGEPGVSLGLFGAWGGTVRLPRVMGEGDALDFALSGRVLDAEAALRTGLVSRVVDDPRSVANEIAAGEGDALAAIKCRLRDRRDDGTQEDAEAAAFAELHEAHAAEIARRRER
ncbi:enoyl-CoA hydratase [Halorubrum californiense DSM 19288]|uniref:Enoyl-CoA hydratase n=1 Tax=Halorubrum californiense DSM 19288 TaxID=1227465 RepID=M0EGC7_9EURY|nr:MULTISPECIES: enoyl-CoA hydratase/isomerase family protein [Halorubrum]ELZ46108.1 enoyl-CoA hydratase [Halorubrum californiense DSM 19288]TKX67783.1 enoyl-CoA hydratase/isomerase family protein [Halorubrum sp. GN11GM_10-3_MGM]